MSNYHGDWFVGDQVFFKFTTVNTSGVPTVLAGSPVLSIYRDDELVQTTAGVTMTVDFDAVVGLNHVTVLTTAASGFYTTGREFELVITTGTVGGNSVVGYVVGGFSLENRAVVRPTVADRTLDVSTGGEAGLDWANIGSPTTVVDLSGTSTRALQPTVLTRTLDVTAAGEAGIDWANIGSPTTVVDLSGTSTRALQPTVLTRSLDVTATGAAGVDWANVEGQATAVNLSLTTVSGVSAAGANMIADHTLRRTAANARASASGDAVTFRSLLGAVSNMVNRVFESSATNLLITEEDDATAFGDQTITTTATAVTWTDLNTV